jgi:anti-sigma factor ChrR (cupin superfamily)
MPSSSEQQQEQASLYVAGALSADEQRRFEAELRGNADLRALVRELQGAVDSLVLAAPQVAPPPDLKDKVLRRIETRSATNAPATEPARATRAAKPGFLFHGADEAKGWKELPVRGAWIKLLSIERQRGYAVLMGKLEAGVRYPAHTHTEAEELYILTGDLHIGDLSLHPGDFHHADAGTDHGVNYSVEGCTLLAVLPADHELVQFAMA